MHKLPSIHAAFKSPQQCEDALKMYMIKMRTAKSLEDIAKAYGVSTATVSVRLRKVRSVLMKDFVPLYLTNTRDRAELLSHNTIMSQALFCASESPQSILVCDGTYIYVNKSTNYEFQRDTYTDQKKRNFIKFMMVVCTDGTIVHALGPYPARDNDAKILTKVNQSSDAFRNLRNGDILILDRGFRDCVKHFKERGFDVKMPSLVQSSKLKGQLTTIEANKTRLVTATRFVVETRNGHIKTIYSIFNETWNPIAVQHLPEDFSICCALINCYFKTFEPNKEIALDIAERMKSRMHLENKLADKVLCNQFQRYYRQFESFSEYDSLPQLNEIDLIYIALGKYQIKQAASYCQDHLKKNDGEFIIYSLESDVCRDLFTEMFPGERSLLLLLVRLKSRFRSQKTHDTFVLIDKNENNESVVLGYCCECNSGRRTVGCCSHVMTLIWKTLFIKNSNTSHQPAAFLDGYFGGTMSENIDDDE